MLKTLWILSEERPKTEAIGYVLEKFSKQQGIPCFIDKLRIVPVQNGNGDFSFWYEVLGYSTPKVERVLLKIISGNSSFIDFLVFFQTDEPKEGDRPLFMVEETKTDDEESRNTGVFQRCSKFVYAELHYPKMDLNMYYNLHVEQRASQTDTNIFGTRCLRSLGVKIAGKTVDEDLNPPFKTLQEMIDFKAAMRRPPAGNVPIDISIVEKELRISGRLFKSGGLAHDPNIGALTLIASTARKLGWEDKIVITKHGLSQQHVQPRNKFVRIASALDISLEGLSMPKSELQYPYWRYNTTGEKLATIFVHLVVENFTSGMSIFENHAGSEKGYFITSDKKYLALEKYVPGSEPRKSIDIPDLILLDVERKQVLNIEGKTFENMDLGIRTLDNYGDIERIYINEHYPEYEINRSVVLYGSNNLEIKTIQVSFMLNQAGKVILGVKAPELFREAFQNLKEYWAK
jgi:hypothetical protein